MKYFVVDSGFPSGVQLSSMRISRLPLIVFGGVLAFLWSGVMVAMFFCGCVVACVFAVLVVVGSFRHERSSCFGGCVAGLFGVV